MIPQSTIHCFVLHRSRPERRHKKKIQKKYKLPNLDIRWVRFIPKKDFPNNNKYIFNLWKYHIFSGTPPSIIHLIQILFPAIQSAPNWPTGWRGWDSANNNIYSAKLQSMRSVESCLYLADADFYVELIAFRWLILLRTQGFTSRWPHSAKLWRI